jgi:hypothetical protein
MADLKHEWGEWSGRMHSRTRTWIEGSKEKWKTNMAALKAVFTFVKATQQFC